MLPCTETRSPEIYQTETISLDEREANSNCLISQARRQHTLKVAEWELRDWVRGRSSGGRRLMHCVVYSRCPCPHLNRLVGALPWTMNWIGRKTTSTTTRIYRNKSLLL